MVTMKINVGGKRIIVYVSFAHMDKVTFHPEISGQKSKYILQRRIATERELGEEALDYKEIMKIDALMNIIDDNPSDEKLINELRKVYDSGNGVKHSPLTIN